MEPRFVREIVDTLFPRGEGAIPHTGPHHGSEWMDELGVTQGEETTP